MESFTRRPACHFHQPLIGGAGIADIEGRCDGTLRGFDWRGIIRIDIDGQRQNLLVPAAEHSQRAVSRHCRPALEMIEIIGEFFACRLLAIDHLGAENGVLAHIVAQASKKIGVFRHGFRHDVARAFKRCLHIRHLALHIGFAKLCRIGCAVCPDRFGQRTETALAGDFGAGAALRLVGQIKVFQLRLGARLHDLDHQGVRHLALTVDGINNGGAARIEFTQIDEAFGKRSKLGIIQPSVASLR